jgi:hypothetical protein
MRGDNKGKILLERASKHKEFWEDLKTLRSDFDIPKNGFSNRKSAQKWLTDFEKKPKPKPNLNAARALLFGSYKIPVPLQDLFLDYLLTGNKFPLLNLPSPLISVVDPYASNEELLWKSAGQNYVKLLVSETGIADVKTFWAKHQTQVKSILKKRNPDLHRVRKSTKGERDDYIFELSELPLKELRSLSGDSADLATPREILIARLTSQKYGKISPENVRRIIASQRKLRQRFK